MREIANNDLTLDDVPMVDADIDSIFAFALTFNGYRVWGSFDKCAEIGNSRRQDSLTELRTCLFFEQRRWRHFGYDPDESAMEYIRDLVQNIGACVAARDFA